MYIYFQKKLDCYKWQQPFTELQIAAGICTILAVVMLWLLQLLTSSIVRVFGGVVACFLALHTHNSAASSWTVETMNSRLSLQFTINKCTIFTIFTLDSGFTLLSTNSFGTGTRGRAQGWQSRVSNKQNHVLLPRTSHIENLASTFF